MRGGAGASTPRGCHPGSDRSSSACGRSCSKRAHPSVASRVRHIYRHRGFPKRPSLEAAAEKKLEEKSAPEAAAQRGCGEGILPLPVSQKGRREWGGGAAPTRLPQPRRRAAVGGRGTAATPARLGPSPRGPEAMVPCPPHDRPASAVGEPGCSGGS